MAAAADAEIMTEVVREKQNPAVRLHRVMVGLKQRPSARQRSALRTLLGVGGKEPAEFYARLAELHGLPKQVREALGRAQAHEQFLEWIGPIEAALGRLSGSQAEKLDMLNTIEGLDEAITKLYMCIPLLDDHDSFTVTELAEVREAISAASKTVASAKLDGDLADWLTARLDEMQEVLRTAEVVGVAAAKEKLCTLVGRTRFEPCPEPNSDEGHKTVQLVVAIATRVASVVNVGAKIADVLGRLPD